MVRGGCSACWIPKWEGDADVRCAGWLTVFDQVAVGLQDERVVAALGDEALACEEGLPGDEGVAVRVDDRDGGRRGLGWCGCCESDAADAKGGEIEGLVLSMHCN